jgi:hypothetical protein
MLQRVVLNRPWLRSGATLRSLSTPGVYHPILGNRLARLFTRIQELTRLAAPQLAIGQGRGQTIFAKFFGISARILGRRKVK